MLGLAVCLVGLMACVCADIIVYTRESPHTIEEEFRDMPASFGGEIPADGLRGFLTVGQPPDGCQPLQRPPNGTNIDNFTGRWIVLVGRYNCSFEKKVRYAQAAGYDAVIVHNVNSSELETMSAKDPEGIDIPSVFVSDRAGLFLAEEYLYDSGFYIMVNGDPPFNINTHLLLPFAIIVALCLLVIVCFLVVKCIKDRQRARRHRLPSRFLKKIPTCKFSKGDPYDTCAICLDDYQEGEKLRVLPCAHAYHSSCIDPWLTKNRRVCPVCKRRVLVAGERRARRASRSGSESDTEPLVNERAPITQGGTFEAQSENPFVRAARFMARLRVRRAPAAADGDAPPDAEEAPASTENEQTNDVTEDNVQDDSQPLLRARVSAETERGARRGRGRRARSSPRAPADAPPAPPPQPDRHSINAESHAEIGVAALPAAGATATNHHIVL